MAYTAVLALTCLVIATAAAADTGSSCKQMTCQNGGQCQSVYNVAFCVCPMGYVGSFCQTSNRIETDTVTGRRASHLRLEVSGTHVVRGGHRFFLSGANSAWQNQGQDFGAHQYIQHSRTNYLRMLDDVHDAGGNSMRTWVHVHGATSPIFDSHGYVTGLDNGDGSFLEDWKKYLDDAQARDILIFACLWNGARVNDHPEHLESLITDTNKLQSYIDHALIPWVRAVKDHPAMGGWDIINEMEGILKTGTHSSEYCFDTQFLSHPNVGWAGELYTAEQLLRFINWQVDAIKEVDPQAFVTAGSAHENTQTDHMEGKKNLYKNSCLFKAGGKRHGLSFYSTHTYTVWHNQFNPRATFLHDFRDFGLDKPLVIAEFSQAAGGNMSSADQFTWAYEHGYSGAWSWQMRNPPGHNGDYPDTQKRGMESIRSRNDQNQGGAVQLDL